MMKGKLTLQTGSVLAAVGVIILFFGNLFPNKKVSREDVNIELTDQISGNIDSLILNLKLISVSGPDEGAKQNALDQIDLIKRKVESLRIPLGARFTILDIMGAFILSSGITSIMIAISQFASSDDGDE